MLVLTRSRNQTIRVGHDVSIRVLDVRGNLVRLGVDAPRDVPVDREEIYLRKHRDGIVSKTHSIPEPESSARRNR